MFYRVNIDGEVYEGAYTSAPDAVNGAMIKQMFDKQDEFDIAIDLSDSTESWRERRDAYSAWVASPKLIGVECLGREGNGQRHKAKRAQPA